MRDIIRFVVCGRRDKKGNGIVTVLGLMIDYYLLPLHSSYFWDYGFLEHNL